MPRGKEKAITPPTANENKLLAAGQRQCSYDVDEIFEFLEDVVFHSELDDDEHVLTWMIPDGKSIGYPKSEDKLEALSRTRQGRACYYATATSSLEPKTKELRNRQDLFKRLHVIVLDDIGTKIPASKIPPAAEPTYVIESSEGNFQYGYVFETPIERFDIAKALIHTVYTSGLTDGGGKLVSKVVRLPCGINGKKDERGAFKVKLTKRDGPRWEPKALVEAMELDIDYDTLLRAPESTLRDALTRAGQVSQWGQHTAVGASLNGYVDPVLEWLYETGRVIQETDEWITVKCPWAHTHSDGDGTAGYAPAGWGLHTDRRAFHCMHDHCTDNRTPEFLDWVIESGGPFAPRVETAIELSKGFVIDPAAGGSWEISRTTPKFYDMAGLRIKFPVKVSLPSGEGKKLTRVSPVEHWLTSPSRVEIDGVISNPGCDERIYKDNEGFLRMNKFTRPTYLTASVDMHHVENFLEFFHYLIPKEEEADYVLKWLANKVRNPDTRGVALLMCTKRFGTGRGTFSKILTALMGPDNTQNVSAKDMLGGDDFAEWQTKLMVICSETRDTSIGSKSYYQAYEHLKAVIDPEKSTVVINPKFGKRFDAVCCTSAIFFSNHTSNAIQMPVGDRRFHTITNAAEPRSPEYYTTLNTWIDKGDYLPSLWRWLHDMDIGDFNAKAPPPETDLKRSMQEVGKPTLDRLVGMIIEEINLPVVCMAHIVEMVRVNIAADLALSEDSLKALRRVLLKWVDVPAAKVKDRLRVKPNAGDDAKLDTRPYLSVVSQHLHAPRIVAELSLPSFAKSSAANLNTAKHDYVKFVNDGGLARVRGVVTRKMRDEGY